MDSLTELRQAVRDHIWLHGPEHFDMAYTWTIDGIRADEPIRIRDVLAARATGRQWTACAIGHAALVATDQSSVATHHVQLRVFDTGYPSWFMRMGSLPRAEQYEAILEHLDRLIKDG